jgi:hypothetical protein
MGRGLDTPAGAERLFSGLLHAGGWPASVLAGQVDLDTRLASVNRPPWTAKPRH